jgi:hypothetical protein
MMRIVVTTLLAWLSGFLSAYAIGVWLEGADRD